MKPQAALVAGQWKNTPESMPVVFPYTGEPFAEVCLADDACFEDAVSGCVSGFEKTRRMPAHERAGILENLIRIIRGRKEELGKVLCLEGGKPKNLALTEVDRATETLRVSAEEARRIDGEMPSLDAVADGTGRMAVIRRFPMGPVLAIAPFNYPLNLACHKIGPSIAAGNPFILKPSSATPLSGLMLGEMAIEAGFPEEAVSVLPCPGSRAEKLATDPRIAFLSFTGGPDAGWRLKEISGRKGVTLELGGNAAVIVHEDADIAYAAKRIAHGGFINSGQNCISVQRVLIHRPIFDAALSAILKEIGKLKIGDPREMDVNVGPMIDEAAAVRAMEKVEEAVRGGAEILCGGTREKALFRPTVLTGVDGGMNVSCREIFAPVVAVSPYDDFREAVNRANATDFGLQHGVFTRDIGRIMYAYEELDAGGIMINDISTFRVDLMPYGGIKGSGIGKEGPRYVIREMTIPKLMVMNMAPAGI